MSDDDLFLQAQHPESLRYAILEDNGTSAWLYLSEPDKPKPVADVWIYNRIEAPSRDEIRAYRDGPPPAAAGFAGPNAVCSNPLDHEWALLWARPEILWPLSRMVYLSPALSRVRSEGSVANWSATAHGVTSGPMMFFAKHSMKRHSQTLNWTTTGRRTLNSASRRPEPWIVRNSSI